MGLPVLVGDRHTEDSGNIAGASLERSERNDACCGTVLFEMTSASTQVVESRWRSVIRFRCSWSQLLNFDMQKLKTPLTLVQALIFRFPRELPPSDIHPSTLRTYVTAGHAYLAKSRFKVSVPIQK